MKLAVKQTILITILVSLVLSAGSMVMVQRSFEKSLQAAVARGGEQQIVEQYALKSSLLNDQFNEIPYADENVRRYVTRMTGSGEPGSARVGVFHEDGREIIANLPAGIPQADYKLLLRPSSAQYLLRRLDNSYYMLISADIRVDETRIYMVNAYDIGYVFQEKQAQIRSHLILNVALILVAGAASAVLSHFLTKPLQKLSRASTNIAGGAYQERTGIRTDDEIGRLSRSFDKMAEAIARNVDALEKQVENQSRFIAAFSHEVKTPTTAIMGYADILRRAPVDVQDQLRYANIVYHEGRRLEAMSHKMMELLNVAEGGIELKPVPVRAFAEKLWESRRSSLQGMALDMRMEDAIVNAEPDLLFSLVSNLLDNAYKAEPKDGSVRLEGKRAGRRYTIRLTDSGAGIPPEDLPHIQEIFYRADKSRSRAKGGAGIGLYLCSRIAKLHGGALAIESAPGAGTSVSFDLEVLDEQPQE